MTTQEWDTWYRFDTTCPKCGAHRSQGYWSRPDVTYEQCDRPECDYRGPLDTTITELRYRFGTLIGEKIYKRGRE